MHRRTPLTLTLTATLALFAAGCTNDPEPPPITDPPTKAATVEPEPTGTPDPQSVDEAEAAAAYEHFFYLTNEVEQRPGAQGWQTDLLPLTTGGHRPEVVNLYTQLEAQGVRTAVPAELVSVTPTEYIPDPTGVGHQQVVFDVCIDATGFKGVLPDGTDTGSWGARGIVKVKMQQINDYWLVASAAAQEGSTC